MTINRRKIAATLVVLILGVICKTYIDLKPVKASLQSIVRQTQNIEITDRNGVPLGISYQNQWNSNDYLPLHAMPDFLLQAFVLSEDKRFYSHDGVDWRALANAVWQNVKSFSRVRGASTITEQTVRIVNQIFARFDQLAKVRNLSW